MMFERYVCETHRPEITAEQAKANTDAWSAKNKPADRLAKETVLAFTLFFFASVISYTKVNPLHLTNNQIETPRGLNAEERATLESQMATYHQPKALFNLLVHGQE